MLRASGTAAARSASTGGRHSSVNEAALYLSLAETIMTPDWAMPSTFRFGASGLLDDTTVLSGGVATLAAGY